MYKPGLFSRCSRWSAYSLGHPAAFGLAVLIILFWAATGPFFHYSDTWQLVVNTGTTVVTFLMVFLIQNTQNHQGEAVQLKLDELIRAVQGAHNDLVGLEDASEEELKQMHTRYVRLAEATRRMAQRGESDTGTPDVAPGPDDALGSQPHAAG
jgi:low affinity Fe/Cu permease